MSSARGALAEWKTVPVLERARYMLAFLRALLAMNDDVTVDSPGRWAGSRVDTIVDMAVVDPAAGGNPVVLTKERSRKLFEAAPSGDIAVAA